jgi:pyruvate/2-oxoglutarate dehydrogenase complex dihydrolipoamide acyltransferase (E2) component
MQRYGAIGVTAVGMFGAKNQSMWFIPLSAATVAVTVGGIVSRPCVQDGRLETKDYLCLTISFNHDIVDGAPAARFIKRFSELLMIGELLSVVPDRLENPYSQNPNKRKSR